MSEGRVPIPPFDHSKYERPQHKWVCGHTCDGCPCRIGPSPSGECRATTECTPQLILKPDETKGTWACTRPKNSGGPCAEGPRPDGTCCRSIVRCKPVRSLRARRGLVTRAFAALCIGFLLIGLSKSVRESFINPAPLSRRHSSAEFAHLAAKVGGGNGCVLCHAEMSDGLDTLVTDALSAGRGPLSFASFASSHPKDFSRMDRSCLACHRTRGFHEVDVVQNPSCLVCHLEHQGPGQMVMLAEINCVACHGNAAQMLASHKLRDTIPEARFARKIQPGLIVPAVLRTQGAVTARITDFGVDHPEFRVFREKNVDPNTLKFNHRLHMSGANIPPVNGRALECAYCHQADSSGAYMERISFERNCRICHSLNFDEHNPGMTLPHGDPAFVRAFLRSLPVQYADYATRKLGIQGRRAIADYVERQINSLRESTRTGEDLERSVFLSNGQSGPTTVVAGHGGISRARFAGCALCHEVLATENVTPVVTPPVSPDRWLLGTKFSHSSHVGVACVECHLSALSSEKTSDILVPHVESCARCHSAKGGVAHSCGTCHDYHHTPSGLRSPPGIVSLP